MMGKFCLEIARLIDLSSNGLPDPWDCWAHSTGPLFTYGGRVDFDFPGLSSSDQNLPSEGLAQGLDTPEVLFSELWALTTHPLAF